MATTGHITEIPITLRLSQQAREKLAERAAQSGQDVDHYTSELIEQAVTRPTLDELLAPVRDDFAKSGMSEKQIMDLGRRELEALRRERPASATPSADLFRRLAPGLAILTPTQFAADLRKKD